MSTEDKDKTESTWDKVKKPIMSSGPITPYQFSSPSNVGEKKQFTKKAAQDKKDAETPLEAEARKLRERRAKRRAAKAAEARASEGKTPKKKTGGHR